MELFGSKFLFESISTINETVNENIFMYIMVKSILVSTWKQFYLTSSVLSIKDTSDEMIKEHLKCYELLGSLNTVKHYIC